MNKFAEILNREHSSIRAARAINLAEEALYAQEEIIRGLEKGKREVMKSILDLQDLAPSTTISLDVVNGKFDAQHWATTLQRKKVELSILEVELAIALETKEEFFSAAETVKDGK